MQDSFGPVKNLSIPRRSMAGRRNGARVSMRRTRIEPFGVRRCVSPTRNSFRATHRVEAVIAAALADDFGPFEELLCCSFRVLMTMSNLLCHTYADAPPRRRPCLPHLLRNMTEIADEGCCASCLGSSWSSLRWRCPTLAQSRQRRSRRDPPHRRHYAAKVEQPGRPVLPTNIGCRHIAVRSAGVQAS